MTARKDASRTAPARRRLGRGLTSLISTPVPVAPESESPSTPPPSTGAVARVVDVEAEGRGAAPAIRMIATDRIRPNAHQPRQRFDEAALQELGASIKTAGLMQPVVVRPDAAGGFELVVGERRWRAAQLVGLAALPAVVRELDDRTAAEWALIENIQREDLNPLERADAFRQLTVQHGMTHQQVAERVGLNRATVTNLLRLHELDDFTKDAVRNGLLSLAHAKLLLAITNIDARRDLARLAIREDWSVRHLQRRTASLADAGPPRARKAAAAAAPHRADLERRLSEHLGTKVFIRPGKQKGSGRLVVEFYSFEQFEGLMQRLGFDTGGL